MNGPSRRAGFLLAVGAVALLLPACAFKVKVSDDWHQKFNKTIPLGPAVETWQEIRQGNLPDQERLATYNRAVRDSVVQITNNWASNEESVSRIETSEGPLNLRVESRNVRAIGLIDEVIPADFVRVKSGLRNETEVDGVGASLLVKQRWTEADSMIPKTGLWYPVTAVLNLDQPQNPVLELLDPTRSGDYPNQGAPVPMAVDYTAPFARDFQDRQHQFLDLPALLKFDKFADRMGMYRVSAFDPEKTACILVHGIYSSPVTWDETLNEMYAERSVRERYEFWTFGYPTGAPIPYLAVEFRDSLRELIEFRRSQGAVNEDLVLIGHSMGGLLSKSVTQRSGDEDWNRFFKVPLEELDLSVADRELLHRMAYYEPIPNVKKVVFCATPHRGSKLAENPAMKLVGDVVQLPSQLARLSNDIVQESRNALTPLGMEIAKEMPTSVDLLRTKRIGGAFLNKPLNPDVSYYSIIGSNRGKEVPKSKITDGVVPYESAHIEGVISEKIVKNSPHGVHKEPEGIAEIIRILNSP